MEKFCKGICTMDKVLNVLVLKGIRCTRDEGATRKYLYPGWIGFPRGFVP